MITNRDKLDKDNLQLSIWYESTLTNENEDNRCDICIAKKYCRDNYKSKKKNNMCVYIINNYLSSVEYEHEYMAKENKKIKKEDTPKSIVMKATDTFSDVMSQILYKKHMTQKDLAKLANMTPAAISRMMNGNRTSIKSMAKLALCVGYKMKLTFEKK